MAPILRRSSRRLAAEDDDGGGDEVEQQPTMKHLPLARQGEQSSDDIESSPDLVGRPAKTPPPRQDQDGREVSGSGGADKPPEPALQAKKPSDAAQRKDEESDADEESDSDDADEESDSDDDSDEDEVPVEPVPQTRNIPPSDGAEHKDEEADSGENGEPPLAGDPNGKRKAPPPQVSESPPQKRMVLQASHEHNSVTTDTEKQFMDKCASYFYLGKEVSDLNEEYPGLFKQPFLELGDDQASALDVRVKKVSLAELRLSLQRRNLEQKVIKSVLKLLKWSQNGQSFSGVEVDFAFGSAHI
ncbi:nucleophosmin-like isoform X2 [Oryza brachyantha]|uniref:nucleophosmin-like isoform X2 n=1 Tax=Oryza brachyantha TaxID=4533 RepID=UPI001ADAA0DD|nr:nucleophosmin-like isoform X2 [Oryza brachyantha]